MKNEKIEMSFDTIYYKKHYRAILTLLLYFEDRENGLQQRHFRYALMKEHGLAEDSIEKMEVFFGDELKNFYSNTSINKGYIGSQQKLTNYLTALYESGIVKKSGKHPNKIYTIAPKYLAELRKMDIKLKIDSYPAEVIRDFDYSSGMVVRFIVDDNVPTIHGYIFGLPIKVRNLLNEKENQDLTTYFLKINENLINIDIITAKHKKDNYPVSLFVTSSISRHKLPDGKVVLENFRDLFKID